LEKSPKWRRTCNERAEKTYKKIVVPTYKTLKECGNSG